MKKQRKRKRKPETALAVRQPDPSRAPAQVLDHVFKTGAYQPQEAAIAAAMTQAAVLLAPHFGVTNAFADQGGAPAMPDTEVLVEVLCSAGAWLAHSRGMAEAELVEKFAEWMKEQGYA
jgi:hypothetical protein